MNADPGFIQLAQQAQTTVDHNNSAKIFNYNEKVRQNLDFSSKNLTVPYPDLKPPTLTRINTEKYIALLAADEQVVRDSVSDGKSTDHDYDNLQEAYEFYAYEPPSVTPAKPPQPKNPLGKMIDDDLGIFGRAIGDTLSVGSKFNFLGTEYVLTNFGRHNIAGVEQIYWVRQ